MASPIAFDKPFVLTGAPIKQFHLLGTAYKNPGILHTVFLSKALNDVAITVQEPIQLNGFCKYAFLQDSGGICGFLLITPLSNTKVSSSYLVVGSESETYKFLNYLQPQGVLIMESSDSNTLFVSTDASSSLLVKVDL